MKFFSPIHLDGGNRGCEAIAKGTAIILNVSPQNYIGLTRNPSLDRFLGLDKYVSLVPIENLSFISKIARKIRLLLCRDDLKRLFVSCSYAYRKFFSKMTSKDVMLSVGGDMFCYPNNQALYTVDCAFRKNMKTVLWGCSMGRENLNDSKLIALKHFSLIYARESLSYNFFKNIGMPNVVCFPDPAFILEPEPVDLPKVFENNSVIGVNLSNFVVENNNFDSGFGKEVKKLLDFIIEKTDYSILLIPHVMWPDQNDYNILNVIKKMYDNRRIDVLDSISYNYCQIRFVIGACAAFVGSRTHSVISAYSTRVPAIAIGYSVKARGIALDLGLDNRLVVDSKKKECENELVDSFKYLLDNRESIKAHLNKTIPVYQKRLEGLRPFLRKFFLEEVEK